MFDKNSVNFSSRNYLRHGLKAACYISIGYLSFTWTFILVNVIYFRPCEKQPTDSPLNALMRVAAYMESYFRP